jgi:PPOX class probable F420-dependent enzyme
LPNKVRQLLEGKNFAHVSTLMPDGSPQVTIVWIEPDGDNLTFNTADGRVKPRNLRRDPRIAISIADSENPYSWAAVRGRMIEITEEGADDQIDRLAKKYLGQEKYPLRRPGEKRLKVIVEPEHVSVM